MYAAYVRRTSEENADLSIVALKRYHEIVEADDWRDLDYESVDTKATKPTKGAIRVNDLLETITGTIDSPRIDSAVLIPCRSIQTLDILQAQVGVFDRHSNCHI